VDLVPVIHFNPIAYLVLMMEWRKAVYTSGVVVGETNHVGYVN
jgi:hypothetical protein